MQPRRAGTGRTSGCGGPEDQRKSASSRAIDVGDAEEDSVLSVQPARAWGVTMSDGSVGQSKS